MWFFNRKVLLTKDNLLKRQWAGCGKCVFCGSNETIEHLFISCQLACQIWRLVHFTFNITPPTSVTNFFGNWLDVVDKITKASI